MEPVHIVFGLLVLAAWTVVVTGWSDQERKAMRDRAKAASVGFALALAVVLIIPKHGIPLGIAAFILGYVMARYYEATRRFFG